MPGPESVFLWQCVFDLRSYVVAVNKHDLFISAMFWLGGPESVFLWQRAFDLYSYVVALNVFGRTDLSTVFSRLNVGPRINAGFK